MRFEAPYIVVARKFENDNGLLDRLEMVMLYMLQFRRFTDSRWISLGGSARTLLAAVVVGLDGLFEAVMSNPGLHHGRRPLSDHIRPLCSRTRQRH